MLELMLPELMKEENFGAISDFTSCGDAPASTESDIANAHIPEVDPYNTFSDSLFSLFSHYVPSYGSPGSSYTYTPPAGCSIPPLTIQIPLNSTSSQEGLFQCYQWASGVLMADLICTGRVKVRGKRVLELGAGTGLPGLVAGMMGAREVILSDYDDPLLTANLQKNISLAFPSALPDHIACFPHIWGTPISSSLGNFDLIILSDTLYSSSTHVALLESLSRLLASGNPDAIIHIVAGLHTGRAVVRTFLDKAFEKGFEMVQTELDKWEEWRCDEGGKGERRRWGWDLSSRRTEAGEDDIAERNRWVVRGSLRFKR